MKAARSRELLHNIRVHTGSNLFASFLVRVLTTFSSWIPNLASGSLRLLSPFLFPIEIPARFFSNLEGCIPQTEKTRRAVSIEPRIMSGQRVMSNPHHTLSLLNQRKEQLQEELRTVEKQVWGLSPSHMLCLKYVWLVLMWRIAALIFANQWLRVVHFICLCRERWALHVSHMCSDTTCVTFITLVD